MSSNGIDRSMSWGPGTLKNALDMAGRNRTPNPISPSGSGNLRARVIVPTTCTFCDPLGEKRISTQPSGSTRYSGSAAPAVWSRNTPRMGKASQVPDVRNIGYSCREVKSFRAKRHPKRQKGITLIGHDVLLHQVEWRARTQASSAVFSLY